MGFTKIGELTSSPLWREIFRIVATSKYRVYVIELSKRVFSENTRFRAANPQFNGVLECLYVGMTSKTPAERFRQHKTGQKGKKGSNLSSTIVRRYGAYLRPSLYDHLNLKPMTRQEALRMEEKLAWDLRRQGYAVWFNWVLLRPDISFSNLCSELFRQ